MYWHAEGMKTLVSGTVKYQGRTYVVKPETSYGYSDKNWGSNFTSPWVWLSSNNLTSKVTGKKLEDSVFDIGGGCPKVFGIPLKRKLLSAFWYEGKPFEYKSAVDYFKNHNLQSHRQKAIQDAAKIIWLMKQIREENCSEKINEKEIPQEITPEYIYGYSMKERLEKFKKQVKKEALSMLKITNKSKTFFLKVLVETSNEN